MIEKEEYWEEFSSKCSFEFRQFVNDINAPIADCELFDRH